ncbi:MAG: InlB B-repeat-containing protein, partial [Oscillospiraceae bacterium]|nr:InlB B-repeat-containing protein [Oscillospiraceae bacterium]
SGIEQNGTGHREFYAKWGDGNTPDVYNITYHNVYGAANPNPATYTILDTAAGGLTLQALTDRLGYTFTGWYTDAAFTAPASGIEQNGTGHREFYAKWGDGNTPDIYNITYHNVNGATNPNPATYTILDTKDSGLALRDLTDRLGYTFTGWYTDDTYTVKVTGIEVDGVGSREFWAKWGDGPGPDEPNTYNIIYHNVQGVTNQNPATYTILNTEADGLALQGLTGRPGYTFTGWYADAGYTVLVTKIEKNGTEDRDYWAKWGDGGPDNPNKPDTYTITYQNVNGAVNSNPAVYTIIDTPVVLKAPVRTGYTFEGWYADSAYTTPVTRIDEGSTGSRTFWAKWKNDADVYAITYHNVQGAYNPNPATYTILYTPLSLNGLIGRPGYTFDGWYADPGYTVRVTAIEAGGTVDRDYWAKWGDGGPDNPNKPDRYTITYHMANGMTNPNPTTYTIIDTPVSLRAPGSLPAGYQFAGWYADAYYTVPVTRIEEGTTGDRTYWARIIVTP